MTETDTTKRLLTWRLLIGVLSSGALVWSASMLVAGLAASGQLDSPDNPLGEWVKWAAALCICGASALYLFVMGTGRNRSVGLMVGTSLIALALTVFASLTQTFAVVDAALGENVFRGAQTQIAAAWDQAERADQAMSAAYLAQLDYLAQRRAEEAETGKGPRFRAVDQAFNDLRETYGAGLSVPAGRAPSRPEDPNTARQLHGYLDRLEAKAALFVRFAQEVGVAVVDPRASLTAIRAELGGVTSERYVDRRSLVYGQVIQKMGEMIASGGAADIGFSLAVMLAFMPDAIQLLCTLLLILLRPRPVPEPRPAAAPGGQAPPTVDLSTLREVWRTEQTGSAASAAVH